MSDEITCPDCEGRGNHLVGHDKDGRPLHVGCPMCQGVGKVGGQYGEPAEEPPPPAPVDPLSTTPVWDEPGWNPNGCPTCGGSGEVISMGGAIRGGEARRGIKVRCPACRASQAG